MHGKRNERCWHKVGGSKQESSRQGCVEDVCLWPIPWQGWEAMMMMKGPIRLERERESYRPACWQRWAARPPWAPSPGPVWPAHSGPRPASPCCCCQPRRSQLGSTLIRSVIGSHWFKFSTLKNQAWAQGKKKKTWSEDIWVTISLSLFFFFPQKQKKKQQSSAKNWRRPIPEKWCALIFVSLLRKFLNKEMKIDSYQF